MKIAAFQINPLVGDIKGNTAKIVQSLKQAKSEKADMALFPELAISGYPPDDLLFFHTFLEEIAKGLKQIVKASKGLLVVVGTVRKEKKNLFNSAAVIANGKLLGFKDKTLLPDYDVFNESRYFKEGNEQKIWKYKNQKIGVLICEDTWEHSAVEEECYARAHYQCNPVLGLKKLKPDLVLSLNASPYYFKKQALRLEINKRVAKTLNCPLVYCNQIGGNDSLVFDGSSFFIDKKGCLQKQAKSFAEDVLMVETGTKKLKAKAKIEKANDIEDLYSALVLGVKDYFKKQGLNQALIGLSGGVDSAVTACIAKDALGSENVLTISMPSRYTAPEGIEDSYLLAKNLKIKIQDLPIDGLFQDFLDYLSPVFYGLRPSTAEENLQARIRSVLLMAISNKWGHIVLSTGNKSEIAIGYVTLYGDMSGGLAVLSDVTKTFVYKLAGYINRNQKVIPQRIIDRPPSAELRENQKDSDDLPDYKIVDLVLTEYVEDHRPFKEIVKRHRLDEKMVKKMIRQIHLAEYKRRQAAPGIIVTKKAFGRGRNFPIVQGWA